MEDKALEGQEKLMDIMMENGRLAVTLSPVGEPQCHISFPSGELSGPLYEVLAAATALVGDAKLDGAITFGHESHVTRNGGVSRHELATLRELLEAARVPLAELGAEGRDQLKDVRYCGCFAGIYPDRTDSDKFVFVYATSTSLYGHGRRDECGCFASRISLSDPNWAETVDGISPLGPRILDRTPPEYGMESVGVDEERFVRAANMMLEEDPLPGKCFSNRTLAELRRSCGPTRGQEDDEPDFDGPSR